MINQDPFTLSVNSLKRLKISAALVHYYESLVIELTVVNICCPFLKSFEVQMKAFKERNKEGTSSVPKIINKVTFPK